MRWSQYRIKSLLIICAFVAAVAAWAHDHNHLREQLKRSEAARAEEKLESQKVADELARHNQLHARSRLEFDKKQNGQYERLPATHPAYSSHPEAISKLKDLGVQLYVNRHDEVILADVPDTTNFEEVFTELQAFPTLGFVYFTTGPLPRDIKWDWDSVEFREVEAESPTVAAAYSTNVERAFSPALFIVDVLQVELTEDRSTGYYSRRYYFWFCGIVTPTPNPISRSIGKCEELWFWATSPFRPGQGGVI